MTALRVAFIAFALLGVSQAQCVGRIQYPVCAPAAPVTIPVTITVDKCATSKSAAPGRATVCTDDLSTLLLLGALGNQNQQPQQPPCNNINADQLINKLVNALVYIYTTGGNGGSGSGGKGGSGGSQGNGGGSGGKGDNDPVIDLSVLGPNKKNLAGLGLAGIDLLNANAGPAESKGGLGGTLKDVLGGLSS